MSLELHIHLHGDVHIHVPPTGDIPSPLFTELKELITMNEAERKQALTEIREILVANGQTQGKALDELTVKLSQIGVSDPDVDALIVGLKDVATAQAALAKQLDDLVPDAPPAP